MVILMTFGVRKSNYSLKRSVILTVFLSVGLVFGELASAQTTENFSYDSLGRLIKVERGTDNNRVDATYQFDKAGNRTQVSVSAPAQITNGSFEFPAVNNYVYVPTSPGMQFSGKAGIAADGGDWGFVSPWQGRQVAFLQSSDGLTGAVDMKVENLVPGRHYRLAFAVARRPNYPENVVRVFINDVSVWEAAPPTASNFTPYPTSAFLASGTSATVRFSSSATSYDSSSALDAISIERLD